MLLVWRPFPGSVNEVILAIGNPISSCHTPRVTVHAGAGQQRWVDTFLWLTFFNSQRNPERFDRFVRWNHDFSCQLLALYIRVVAIVNICSSFVEWLFLALYCLPGIGLVRDMSRTFYHFRIRSKQSNLPYIIGMPWILLYRGITRTSACEKPVLRFHSPFWLNFNSVRPLPYCLDSRGTDVRLNSIDCLCVSA